MIIKELMIDDVVREIGDETTIRVAKIDKIAIRDADEEIFFFDGIEPIPLTEEILEKNGWAKCKYKAGTCKIIYEYEDSHRKHTMIKRGNGRWLAHIVDANKHPDEYMCCYATLSMFYVHQLQQALRLCGLNDLADNFKIQ